MSRSEAPNHHGSAATNTSDPHGILRPLPTPPASTHIDLGALQRAVRDDPANGRGWYELGCALNRSGRAQEAVGALDCALTLAPDQPAIICERGLALLALRSLAGAAEAFEEVLALQPLNDLALFGLANVKYRQGRMADAAALWRQAADIADDPTDALESLATTLHRLQRPEDEREVWREIVRRQPQHPVALHHLAALGEGGPPKRASDAYLTKLFNDFAPEFDVALAAIGYQGPQLLAQLARQVFGDPRAALDILDAGCGTGLSGEPFRPWARKLIGLDLSEGMLAKARQRGIYDELIQAEITGYLAGQRLAYDAIVFGDALTYFGDLSAVLAAAAGALRPGGGILCSLETMSAAADGATYQLQGHGRYCHALEYVRRICTASGLTTCRIDHGVLRHEAGEPVACLVVGASRAREPGCWVNLIW